MRRVQLAVFAMSLVVLASAGGASAKPTWLAPRDLSLPGGSAESPQVALDAAGNALVVWYRWSGQVSVVQAAEHRAGGTWGAPRNLSPPGSAAYYPQLAVNAAGDAVAVWVGSSETGANVVQAAARSGGGAWGRAEDLAAGNDPRVALAPDGTAVAVWERFDGATSVVQAAIRPPGWPWSAPRDLSAPGAYAAYQQVALDHHGNAVAVWRRFDGANWIVQAAAYPSGGGWSAPQSLSAPGQDAEAPQVALDRYGNAIAVWRRFDGANWIVQTAFRPYSLRGGGVWSAPQDISTPRYDARGPEVAFDAYGHALAIWTRNEDTVQVDERPVGGPWEPAQDLVAPGFLTDDAHVALNSAGDAIAVWRRSETGEHGIVQAARRPAGGVWGAPQVLSPAGQAAFDPQVDVDPAGNALAAWSRFGSGPDNVVQADPLDAAGPIFRGLSVPARVDTGSPVLRLS